MEFDERDFVHCLGGLERCQSDERHTEHRPNLGDHVLFVDLYGGGRHQHYGYGDRDRRTRGDGDAERESGIDCEGRQLHVDVEFDERDFVHRRRWLERCQSDERHAGHRSALGDHVVYVDVYGGGRHQHCGYGDRDRGTSRDGDAERKSDVGCERCGFDVDVELDECDFVHCLRWLERWQSDERHVQYRRAHDDYLLLVDLHRYGRP